MNFENKKDLTKLKKLSVSYLSLWGANVVVFLLAFILLMVWQYSIKNSVTTSTTTIDPKNLNLNDFLNKSTSDTASLHSLHTYLFIYL